MTLIEENLKNTEYNLKTHLKKLKLEGNSAETLKNIAFCYKDLGNINLAIKYFLLAKNLSPFDKTVYYELGKLELLNNNSVKAIKLFMRAIKLSPDYIEAIISMGEAHECIAEYDMAEMIYLKVLEKNPVNKKIYERLGFLYLKTCDYKKAINCFSDILAVDENYSEAYFGLAKCFDETGKIFEARRYYKKYLNIEPFSCHKKFVQTRLSFLSGPKKILSVNSSHLRVV